MLRKTTKKGIGENLVYLPNAKKSTPSTLPTLYWISDIQRLLNTKEF